jgi:osmotically-inducible protein OsmY
MTRTFATITAAALLMTIPGCSRVEGDSTVVNERATEERLARDDSAAKAADAATAQEQAETSTDRALTREIRQAIAADDSLSTNARNVTVITSGGVVTLRGPVANEQERNAIAAKAEGTTGVKRLDNQLEVAGPNS